MRGRRHDGGALGGFDPLALAILGVVFFSISRTHSSCVPFQSSGLLWLRRAFAAPCRTSDSSSLVGAHANARPPLPASGRVSQTLHFCH